MNLQRMVSAKIFVLLGFLTIIFWLLSINYTPSIDKILPPDPFFFAKNLSVFYWLSLAPLFTLLFLRLITSTYEKVRRLLDVFLIGCLVLVIYATPCFTYSLPVYVDTYIHTSASLKILLRGHTPPSESMMAASNEPGSYFFFSVFMLLTGLDSLVFMRYYPILISSILLLVLYITSLKFASPDFAIISPFVYTASAYGRIFHVYPANLTYVFYALFLYFLAFPTGRKRESKSLMLLLTFSATIVYILVPPLLFLSSLMPFIPLLWKTETKRNLIAPTVILVIWASWLMYVAQGSFAYIVSWLKEALSGPITSKLSASLFSPASVRIIPLLLKQAITVFVISTGVIIAIFCFMNNKKPLKKILIIGGNFILCCLVIFAFFVFAPEASTRFYSFSLVPYSVLVSLYISAGQITDGIKPEKLRQVFTYVLLVSMILFLLIVPIVRNDNDAGFYYPSSSLKGADFTVENLKGNVVWVRQHLHLIEYMASRRGVLLEGYMGSQQNENVSFISLSRYLWLHNESAFLLYFSEKVIKDYDSIIFNDYEDAYMVMSGEEKYVEARALYEQYISEKLNRIYSSGTLRVYSSNR